MTPNENFKNALKAGNLADALVIALSKATELKITTSVVSVNDYYGKNTQLHPEDCLETKINLLKGEIENKIGENILKNEFYETLQKLHLQEAIESNKLIQNNLETLQKLFTILAELKQQQLAINNPEIVSLHLGNQLPSPPKITYTSPLQKETIKNENSDVIVTDTEPLIAEKSEKKKPNRHQQYDWKTLADHIGELDQTNDIDEGINIKKKAETRQSQPHQAEVIKDEDWGDLIIDESIDSDNEIIETSSKKNKKINTDTTIAIETKANQLITDENVANLLSNHEEFKPNLNDEDLIENLTIEEDDQLNLDTKVISEKEIKAFITQENQRISSEPKIDNENFIFEKETINPNNKEISENEINDFIVNEDWGDLLEDGEELIQFPDSNEISLTNSDDDWDEVIEDLYEPKISNQNQEEK